MNREIKVICPYCGESVNVFVTNDYRQKMVVTCYEDDGGCGKDFVVGVEVKISAKALKIEGDWL